MSTLVQAKRKQKQWVSWLSRNIPSYAALDAADEQRVLEQMRAAKREAGPALSYQLSAVPKVAAVDALVSGLVAVHTSRVIAVLGDAECPVLGEIAVGDLHVLLTQIYEADATLGLGAIGGDAYLCVDLSESEVSDCDLLVSASGAFEKVMTFIMEKLPGGAVFRGN